MAIICGFAAVNAGRHCWVKGRCAVCKVKQVDNDVHVKV